MACGWARATSRQHVSSIISGLFSLGGRADEALLQQRVVPHPAFERISFQGTADVRVIVYRGVPAMAMLRLPTQESGGRANLHQGAIGAGVDLKTGPDEPRRAAQPRHRAPPGHRRAAWSVSRCPTGRRYWHMSRRVSEATGLGYVGVDVVVDRRHGPLLLEANARPGLAIQIANGAGLGQPARSRF